jgi:hypothetical protein
MNIYLGFVLVARKLFECVPVWFGAEKSDFKHTSWPADVNPIDRCFGSLVNFVTWKVSDENSLMNINGFAIVLEDRFLNFIYKNFTCDFTCGKIPAKNPRFALSRRNTHLNPIPRRCLSLPNKNSTLEVLIFSSIPRPKGYSHFCANSYSFRRRWKIIADDSSTLFGWSDRAAGD